MFPHTADLEDRLCLAMNELNKTYIVILIRIKRVSFTFKIFTYYG